MSGAGGAGNTAAVSAAGCVGTFFAARLRGARFAAGGAASITGSLSALDCLADVLAFFRGASVFKCDPADNASQLSRNDRALDR